jgi:hypothetical protein
MSKSEENRVTYEVTTIEDPETGDIILPFPPELLEKMNWKEGDTLVWNASSDGSWIISKK